MAPEAELNGKTMSNDITLDVGEVVTVLIDFSKELENPRRDNFQYSTSEFVTIGAYVYECTNAGKTASDAPESLTKTIGATQDDGTVEWTCRDFSTSGSDTISSYTITPSSAALTISAAPSPDTTIVKSTYLNITITAVTAGSHSVVAEVVTAEGETLRHTYKVFVY